MRTKNQEKECCITTMDPFSRDTSLTIAKMDTERCSLSNENNINGFNNNLKLFVHQFLN